MARGRKSEKIGRITKRDGQAMKSIAHTGVISKYNAKTYFNLNERRLNILKKNNYLIEHACANKNGVTTYYTLGKNGKGFIKEKTNIDFFYRSNSNQIKHDLALNKYYCERTIEEQDRWINENQIIHKWSELANNTIHITGVDAIIQTDMGTLGIEVVTNNYGAEEMQQKYDAAQNLNCEGLVIINAR